MGVEMIQGSNDLRGGGSAQRREPWAAANLALLASVVLVTFALVRVFRVSHNEVPTALGVLAATGGISAIVGVVLSEIQRIVEIGLVAMLVLYLEAEYPEHKRDHRDVNVLATLLVGFWIAAVSIGHFIFAIASIVLGLPFVLSRIVAGLRGSTKSSIRVIDWISNRLSGPPDHAPGWVKSWYSRRRARMKNIREDLHRQEYLEGLGDAAIAALADRDLSGAREAIPPGIDISDDELRRMMQEVAPSRGAMAFNRRIRILGIFYVVLFASNMSLSDNPWDPKERIVTEGSEPRSGFVLDDTSDSLVVLWDSPRQVERISTVNVLAREICSDPARPRFPTLSEILFGRGDIPEYPACPPR